VSGDGVRLRQAGFAFDVDQPEGAVDYIAQVGIFRLRVRIPVKGSQAQPALWVGYTAGGPLIEIRSKARHHTVASLVADVVMLRRVLGGY